LMGVYEVAGGGANADIYNGLAASSSSNKDQALIRAGIRAKF